MITITNNNRKPLRSVHRVKQSFSSALEIITFHLWQQCKDMCILLHSAASHRQSVKSTRLFLRVCRTWVIYNFDYVIQHWIFCKWKSHKQTTVWMPIKSLSAFHKQECHMWQIPIAGNTKQEEKSVDWLKW